MKKLIVLLIILGLTGCASPAGFGSVDEEYVYQMTDKTISLSYTDDNADEDYTILTNKEFYGNGLSEEDIYFTVINNDVAKDVDVNFLFQGSENIIKIEKHYIYSKEINTPIYKQEEYECDIDISSTTTEIEKTLCDRNIQIGTSTETKYYDGWSEVESEMLLGTNDKKIDKRKVSKDIKKEQKFRIKLDKYKKKFLGGDAIVNDFQLFKATVSHDVADTNEFFIEVFGDDGTYAHLDPSFGNDGGGTWARKCALTIESSVITSDQTNFPVLLTLATLPSEMFDADGSYPAINGGADIRFTSDEDGDTEIPFEVVSFVTHNTPANGSAEIWVKTGIDGDTDTDIYVWYNNSSATAYAIDATYGAENVWTTYQGVWHMGESSGTAADSTSGSHSGTFAGDLPNSVSAQISNGQDYDGAGDKIKASASSLFGEDKQTISMWFNVDFPFVDDSSYMFFDTAGGKRHLVYKDRLTDYLILYWANVSLNLYTSVPSWWSTSDYVHMEISVDTTETTNNVKVYINGALDTTKSITCTKGIATDFLIGVFSNEAAGYFDGIIEETRIYNELLTADWISSEYNNQNSPSTFVTEGTPEDAGGDAPPVELLFF